MSEMSQQLVDWIRGGERRELLGHRIFVRAAVAEGRPPLLLIHGFPTASYDWHLVWPRLVERFSVYALDLLGFGLSDKPAGFHYTIGGQADLCQAYLESCGVEQAHVIAHDYGDTVAQELLAREREGRVRLLSAVFLNGGLFPESHRPRAIQRLLATPVLGTWLARSLGYRRFETTMRSIAGDNPPARQEWLDLWSLIERRGGRVALSRLLAYMAERRRNRPRWVGALVESRVRRMLICGAADPISGAQLAERYRQLVPDARVRLLAGVGHYPQLEAPDQVLASCREFHDDLRPATRPPR